MADSYWLDGQTFDGIVPNDPAPVVPNTELYWVDGYPAVSIFTFSDGIPYTPPSVVYPTVGNYYGNETFWIDAFASPGIKTNSILTTNSEYYWADGSPELYIFPVDFSASARFFMIFE